MPYDARAVANALLDLAERRSIALTHIALHKIAFYAHGWHLLQRGSPLIRQEFEAWEDGPVQRQVWETLKTGKHQAVRRRATRFDPIDQRHEEVPPNLAQEDLDFLDAVLASYGHIAGGELSEMTHAKGGPWDRVWNAPDGRVNLGMRISNQLICEHFLAVTTSLRSA